MLRTNVFVPSTSSKNRINSCTTGSTNFSFTCREFRIYVTSVHYRGLPQIFRQPNRPGRASVPVVSLALISLLEILLRYTIAICKREKIKRIREGTFEKNEMLIICYSERDRYKLHDSSNKSRSNVCENFNFS